MEPDLGPAPSPGPPSPRGSTGGLTWGVRRRGFGSLDPLTPMLKNPPLWEIQGSVARTELGLAECWPPPGDTAFLGHQVPVTRAEAKGRDEDHLCNQQQSIVTVRIDIGVGHQGGRAVCSGQVWPWVQQEATASLEQLCRDLHGSWTATPGLFSWSLATRHSSHNDFLSIYYVPGMRTPTGPNPCPRGNYVLRTQPSLTGTSSAHSPKSKAQISDPGPDPRPRPQTQPRLQAQTPGSAPNPKPPAPSPQAQTQDPDTAQIPDPGPDPGPRPQKQTPDPDPDPDPRPQNQIPDPSPRSRPWAQTQARRRTLGPDPGPAEPAAFSGLIPL